MLIKFLDGTSREIADLRGADLRDADLHNVDLRSADLRYANLRYANLSGADLHNADLRDADLRSVNLRDADLSGVIGLAAFCILPAGDIVGYKKLANEQIATLRIPSDAARINAYGSRKCRASYAIVLNGSGIAKYNGTTTYAPGLTVTPDSFDPDPRTACSHGIHFFITEQEAKDY